MIISKELKDTGLNEESLGCTIKTARMSKHLSQEKLAEMLGINPTHLKHIESENRKPSIDVLFNIVQSLHISLDDLLFGKDTQKSEIYRQTELLLQQCTEKELNIVSDIIKSFIYHRENL